MSVIISVVIGYLLDMFIGTPKILKRAKNLFSKNLKKIYGKVNKEAGAAVTLIILILFGVISYITVMFIQQYNMILSIIFESIICYLCISCKEIKNNSERVHKALKRGYIKRATKLFNNITDNGEINEPREIAENIVVMILDGAIDKVISPIFYIIVFGGTGGVVYKLIVIISDSTGQLFARILKNIAEFIPTRIAVVFMLISEKLLNMDCKNALKIFKRDRYNIKSLNRGLVMSLCAGALGTEFNFRKTGTVIGDKKRTIEYSDIKRTFEMINIASLLELVCIVVIRILIVLFAK